MVTYPRTLEQRRYRRVRRSAVHASLSGSQTVLMFEEGDPQRPIIVGCRQDGRRRAAGVGTGAVERRRSATLSCPRPIEMVCACGKSEHHADYGRESDDFRAPYV